VAPFVVVVLLSSSAPAPESAAAVAAREASAAFSRGITRALAADERLAVRGGDDLRAMLAVEAERQASGCALDDSECLAEIADALGAEAVVSGQLARLGPRYALTITVVDPGTAAPIARGAVDG
jgi:hypothetical protein